MKIKINRLSSAAVIPVRKNYNDAGADISLMHDVSLASHEIKKIPLGFSLEIPDGLTGFIMPRSSMVMKNVISQYTPIDSGYRGEISLMLYNPSEERIFLSAGDRVGQLVIVPVVYADFIEDLENTRQTGGFGSTGINDAVSRETKKETKGDTDGDTCVYATLKEGV